MHFAVTSLPLDPNNLFFHQNFSGDQPVSVELKTNVAEISVSIIRVDMTNDRVSLIFTPVCQIDARSYWCVVQ
jgi:hypothetical protein